MELPILSTEKGTILQTIDEDAFHTNYSPRELGFYCPRVVHRILWEGMDVSVRITVFDGAGSIGGNKIYLESNGSSVFFDFGLNFSTWSRFFDEFLRPRSGLGLLDYVATGLIPPIPGLYRQDLEPPGVNLWQDFCKEKHAVIEPQAVLLSHAHSDHIQLISLLKQEIPVYCSLATAVIAKAGQDTGQSTPDSEVTSLVPKEAAEGLLRSGHYKKYPSLGRTYIIADRQVIPEEAQAFWASPASSRELHSVPLRTLHAPSDSTGGADAGEEPVHLGQIGDLPVQFFPVDHSIPGAGAWAVRTPEGWVVYTGDLRVHGSRKSQTMRFIEQAARLEPLALICEGTHPEADWYMSEEAVYENARLAVELSRGIVIADFAASNVERLSIFRRIAADTGRILVISPKDAYLLEALHTVEPQVPNPLADPGIRIYGSNKVTLPTWERLLSERYQSRIVTARHIQSCEGDFILCFSYYDLSNLIDLNPRRGTYIRSSAEPFHEEMILDAERIQTWLDHFRIQWAGANHYRRSGSAFRNQLVSPFHASGHLHGPGLIDLVERIRPRYLIPVHTETPQRIRQMVTARLGKAVRVILPIPGQPVSLWQ